MWLAILLTLIAGSFAQAAVGVRILLGVNDKEATRWDGEVSAKGAQIAGLEPWRFDRDDALQPGNRWTMSTHSIRLFITPKGPIVPNGVIVLVDRETEDAELDVRTAQGNFTVRLRDIPFGRTFAALNGRAIADRIPPSLRLTNTSDEHDDPASAAGSNGALWVAYVQFKHNPRHDEIRNRPLIENMTEKTGGDQVMLARLTNGSWGSPIEITPAGGDVYRPAVAVDGSGRVWVFWSANENGNYDLWARVVENGKPGSPLRLTNAAGADAFAVAATDAKGRAWVAWQAWRNGKASILAATQNGNAFSAPVTVASSAGNEWNPAIAADKSGRVSIAWDTYRNGNYDVYLRTATSPGAWGKETPAAAALTYEAYPTIAYDGQGTLWVAYEEGSERWGKDFGAYESSGVLVYEGRGIRLRGFSPDGRVLETATDVGTVAPGEPNANIHQTTRQADTSDWLKPNPEAWRKRGPNRSTTGPLYNRAAPRNTMPRVLIDASGRIWVAFRSQHPTWWSNVGTVYTEHIVSYAGGEWTGPIFLNHTDNLLDNRPALASVKPGELVVIGSSDGRRRFVPMSYMPGVTTSQEKETLADPYHNDLYANHVVLGPATAEATTKAASAATVTPMAAEDKAEQAMTAAARKYRLKSGNENLRMLRGEFHRHSEMSMDGGMDGTIIDQYRYMIDASYMDWVGCCDHDNGGGREYSWWVSQKLTDLFYSPNSFVAMYSYERSIAYPEGHRNVIFAQRGIRPLPRLPRSAPEPMVKAPDTQLFYAYLRKFKGVVASHTSGTNMGTDWRDNDPVAEPVVEIYQGDRQSYEMPDSPRAMSQKDAIGGWRPKGWVNLALEKGYKLGFQASSDHTSTHMSYAVALSRDGTREALLEAFQKRHVYGATDHIRAEFLSGPHMMGDVFSAAAPPSFRVRLTGTAPFAKVHVIKNNQYVYTTNPDSAKVDFSWRDATPDKGKTSYYYVRGEQSDGEIVWVSPMWVTYTGN